jgi:hypothetical protein
MTEMERFRDAWDALTEDQVKSLEEAQQKNLQLFWDRGEDAKDMSAYEALEEYVSEIGWDGDFNYDAFLTIIED